MYSPDRSTLSSRYTELPISSRDHAELPQSSDAGPAAITRWLIRWADVVLHNFRIGVSRRLGIDEASVARLNPAAVYCHVSAFGSHGPRALLPGNDALMQALTGSEAALGGAGNDPLAATWIPSTWQAGGSER